MEYLFVYGTLLKDLENEMSKFLASHSKFISKGYFYGKLYKVTWFPGAILSTNTLDKVYGMVFKIENPEAVFNVLDDYEGIGEKYPEPQLFKKLVTTAFLEDGSTLKTWVYLYNLPVKGLKQITSGNYLKYTIDK
ncbi:Uncharacterized conserved protein YtfP, gamma-glutamylcyclotransferase (GGCT)/AIG2-like family [Flaviramulus basaltis]|uniref:Uncharacterized conserved protein YtfP, gamma-glutamylcyclotransferase (GGCT)/AIG2-like family n=1 Tax=Flaviramulus basaltis TaxID=369401 RepID=A0A1K2IPM1_9FLAO|nr:gamma-glutamylcyclotransferase family protein [Flaviramulus basaltis]SFZ94388.1 Uncharacterized conserved protein YtfP, gamma-glutamylcyclotransferase (GGCT)/AIG2-like family [Flaviramulus basaltis]